MLSEGFKIQNAEETEPRYDTSVLCRAILEKVGKVYAILLYNKVVSLRVYRLTPCYYIF